MAGTRIEQIIDDIYDFLDGCKTQALSQSKIIVQRDSLYDLLDELRTCVPDEIKKYRKIVANRDGIISQAEQQAEEIRDRAGEEAQRMVEESSIVQKAYAQANEIVQSATEEAINVRTAAKKAEEDLKNGVMNYAYDLMDNMEKLLSDAYEQSRKTSEELVNTLKLHLDKVHSDQSQLNEEYEASEESGNKEESANYNGDDYDFPEGTFLEDI